jgi:hypothetical protein
MIQNYIHVHHITVSFLALPSYYKQEGTDSKETEERLHGTSVYYFLIFLQVYNYFKVKKMLKNYVIVEENGHNVNLRKTHYKMINSMILL